MPNSKTLIRLACVAMTTVYLVFFPCPTSEAQPVSVSMIAKEGDFIGTATIDGLNSPAVNSSSQVGFLGSLSDGDRFIWFDDGVIWLNSDGMPVDTLTGGEATIGIGTSQEFLYSPSYSGADAVYSHNGLLLVDGAQAPGFDPGVTNTFNSRPAMTDDGMACWVAGFNESGGTSTEGRVLYKSVGALPENTEIVLKSGDMVGGFMIKTGSAGIDFDFQYSHNGAHYIQVLVMDTGSTLNDDFMYVDGTLIARETEPAGNGDNWDNFDQVSINNNGDYIFTGDTDGDTSSDEFIAYNGTIVISEGDTLDGQVLESSSLVRGASINDNGDLLHAWRLGSDTEALFFGRAYNPVETSVLLLKTGDEIDIDGDEIADYVVDDFLAGTFPGINPSNGPYIYLEVDVLPVGGVEAIEAIIGVPIPPRSLDLTCEISGIDLTLEWSTVEGVAAYWVYGADNLPWFVPGPAPGFENRLAVVFGDTTWIASQGVGDPDHNWTYMIIAVDDGDVEMIRSNRIADWDFDADIP